MGDGRGVVTSHLALTCTQLKLFGSLGFDMDGYATCTEACDQTNKVKASILVCFAEHLPLAAGRP